jgi:acyl dehydratase
MKFEEFKPGLELRLGPRHVTEQEIIDFARAYDPQPFHIDVEAARRSRWQGLIASGWQTCGFAMRLCVDAVLEGSNSIGSPGIDELRWTHPVRPGDDLTLIIRVLESRVSGSGTTGSVRWRWELHNQAEVQVLSLVATSLFGITKP